VEGESAAGGGEEIGEADGAGGGWVGGGGGGGDLVEDAEGEHGLGAEGDAVVEVGAIAGEDDPA